MPMSYRRGPGCAHDDDDDDFYGKGGTAETQKLLMRDQDDTIRGLAASVQRVQGMALMVNEELASQNRLIEDIDGEVDRTDSRLKGLQGKLKQLANDKNSGQYCVIFVLLIVLAFLVFQVLG